ncbi:MAG: CehA/McbA family metallohydrolase [Lentisphaeria bacterium]|nr:CehA/McbA family metallohydrolase [Lentisphaeria bacterium]
MAEIILVNTGAQPATACLLEADGQRIRRVPVSACGTRGMQAGEGLPLPFVVPGPGCVISHFPNQGPRLLFGGVADGQAKEFDLWIDVPPGLPLFTLHAWFIERSAARGGWEGDELQTLEWRCPPSAYTTAEIQTGGRHGLFHLRVPTPQRAFRFSVAEGLPLLMDRPKNPFPYAIVEAELTDPETLRSMDGRISLWRGPELLAIADTMAGETARFFTLPGGVQVRAEHGIDYRQESSDVQLRPGSVRRLHFPLQRQLRPDSGWVWGDQHTHTFHNDGGQSPAANARAARAEGLHYMFLSDSLEAFHDGFEDFNKTGRFLGMPGQEVDTPFTHCNGLNVRTEMPHLPYGARAERYPGPSQWIEVIRRQRECNNPCLLQLNHPSHSEALMRQPALGYFRSWWVADEFPDEVRVVENFDLPSWFDRLSRGRRLTGVWTTDGHDAVWLPPGSCRVGLYTHGRLTAPAVIDALRRGRVFCTRRPGALLYLAIGDAMPGDTIRTDGGALRVQIRAQSSRPIERVDIVRGGEVVGTLDGEGRSMLDASIEIGGMGQWVLALLYADDAPYPDNGHCGNPLDRSGVLAFTNPIFLR